MTDTGQPTIGTRLRTAREASGLTLRQIADVTKLTIRTLEAIENDAVTQLPGGLYRRAIVRNFAREVQLDPEVTLRAFLAQHPDDLPPLPPLPTRKPTSYDLPPEPEAPRPEPRRWRALLGLLGALVPIAAGIFYFTIALRGHATPTPGIDTWTAPARAAERPQIVQAAVSSEARPASGGAMALMISVSSVCDLRVVADGRQVVSRTMAAGELIEFSASEEVVLTGSDAGAVHASLNGQASRRFGNAGAPLDVRIGHADYQTWLAK